jgi:hypothetical protein
MPFVYHEDKNDGIHIKGYTVDEYIQHLEQKNKQLLQRLRLSKRDNRTNRDRLRKRIENLKEVINSKDDLVVHLLEPLEGLCSWAKSVKVNRELTKKLKHKSAN